METANNNTNTAITTPEVANVTTPTETTTATVSNEATTPKTITSTAPAVVNPAQTQAAPTAVDTSLLTNEGFKLSLQQALAAAAEHITNSETVGTLNHANRLKLAQQVATNQVFYTNQFAALVINDATITSASSIDDLKTRVLELWNVFAGDDSFKDLISNAVVEIALGILQEDPTTSGHADRAKAALRALSNQGGFVAGLLIPAAAIGVTSQTSLTDAITKITPLVGPFVSVYVANGAPATAGTV